MEGEDTGCGAVVRSQQQGKQAGRGKRNPTTNAKYLAWESRVRRIAEEEQEGKYYKITL